MTAEFTRRVGGEYYRTPEAIAPQMFLEDNRSPEAIAGRAKWEENRRLKRQILTVACSDSRVVLIEPPREIAIRAVSAGIDPEEFLPAIENPNVEAINLMGHHSGKDLKRGEAPSGCGGMGVRKELSTGKTPKADIERWVIEHVEDADPLLHLLSLGKKVLATTEKKMLFSSQDQLDKTVYPIFAYLNQLITPASVDLNDFRAEIAYAQGIPHLIRDQLMGSAFDEYLLSYYQERFPKFHSWAEVDTYSQESQNPGIYLVTTNIRPAQVCYPHLSEKPGDMFVTTVPRRKNVARDRIEITDEAIENVLCQAQYPISHFSKLLTILIETGDMEQSLRIAGKLKQKSWAIPWFQRSNTQIMIGQIRRGILEDIQILPKAA